MGQPLAKSVKIVLDLSDLSLIMHGMDTTPSAAEAAIPDKPHLGYREVQKILDCGRTTVRNLVAEKRLVAVQLTAGHRGITRESVILHLQTVVAAPGRYGAAKQKGETT